MTERLWNGSNVIRFSLAVPEFVREESGGKDDRHWLCVERRSTRSETIPMEHSAM